MSIGLIHSYFSEIVAHGQQSQVAGFIVKTFQILNMEEYQKIIYWGANESEFVVKDVIKFQQIVLPRFFRHNKMNSFVRQLNMYGFHKIKHNNFKSTFRHQYFKKDREDLLPLIRRKLRLNGQQEELRQSNIQIPTKKQESAFVQEAPPSPNQNLGNLTHQFLITTKMINMSLVKVSYNDLTQISNFMNITEEDDCASIEDQLEKPKGAETQLFNFQDPSCFFAFDR